MENSGEKYCALCHSTITTGNFKKIDSMKDILEVILLKLDFDGGKQLMCEMCSLKVMEAFKFKSMCIYTDNTIIPYIGDEAECSVDLREIYAKENGINMLVDLFDESKVCRLCMQLIRREFISLRDVNVNMIENYIPEINSSIVEDPVICRPCFDSLDNHSTFIMKCLEVEEKYKPLLISSIKTEEIEVKSEVSEQEVKLGQTECNVAKSQDENGSVKIDSIKIEIKENDESDALFHSDAGLDNRMNMNECDTAYVKTEEQHVTKHKNELEMDTFSDDLKDFSNKYQHKFEMHVATHRNQHDIHDDEWKAKNKSKCNLRNCKHKCHGHCVNHHQKYRKCYICNYKTKDKGSLVKHKELALQIYKCDTCYYRTKYKKHFVMHQIIHKDSSGVQMYKCDTCGFRTKRQNCLVKHQLMHKDTSNVQMYKCDTCNFSTRYKNSLIRHRRRKHKESSELQIYECDTCGFRTKRKNCLVKHQLMHKDTSNVQMYECDTCDFRTKYKNSLVIHQLRHKDSSEEQMYECDTCGFKTKSKDYLVKHQLTHKSYNVQMYECDTCNFRTNYKNSLVKHHQLIHKDSSEVQMYKCDTCGYRTTKISYFVDHQYIHTESSKTQMYKCNTCGIRTTHIYSLIQHQQIHKDSSQVQMYECDTSEFKRKHFWELDHNYAVSTIQYSIIPVKK